MITKDLPVEPKMSIKHLPKDISKNLFSCLCSLRCYDEKFSINIVNVIKV